ncbi:hypothetical protein ABPG74_000307 [Tetrahymena malaccensis]
MGKICTLVVSLFVIAFLLIGSFLLNQQKYNIMEPFEDYVKFNKFVRDANDLNYFLHGYFIFTEQNNFERIDKQLENSNITRPNITDYYVEQIKNSINEQDAEQFFRCDRFRTVISELDTDKINDLFNTVNYDFNSTNDTKEQKLAPKLFQISNQTAAALSQADEKAFDIFTNEIESKSYQQWIVVVLVFSVLFLLIFQCAFVPITYDVYKDRNKKSRRKEARMSKETFYIHLILHIITNIIIIVFIVLFYNTVNDFYDKTGRNSFDLLKYTKKYYFSLRSLQSEELIHIFNTTEGQSSMDVTKNKSTFTDSLKYLQNSGQLKIKFPYLKELHQKYLYNIKCSDEIISENEVSFYLCEKYTKSNHQEKLNLRYQSPIKVNSLNQIIYEEIFEENLIFDHFQIEYCHDIIRQVKNIMEEYISTIQESVLLFLFQFFVCVGFLFIFWVPFFKDKSSYKKEARRFEMVNQI